MFVVSLVCIFFAGCTNTYYTKQQENAVVTEAEVLMREYLDRNYEEYQLDECRMVSGAMLNESIYSGYFASNCVRGYFTVGDEEYIIVANVKNGDIYTSEYQKASCECLKEMLKPYLEEAGYEAAYLIDEVSLEYRVVSEGMISGRKVLDTEVFLEDVYPVKYRDDSLTELFSERNTEGVFCYARLLFHEEELNKFPVDAIEKFYADSAFFHNGEIDIYNVNADDFREILEGNTSYRYDMAVSEKFFVSRYEEPDNNEEYNMSEQNDEQMHVAPGTNGYASIHTCIYCGKQVVKTQTHCPYCGEQIFREEDFDDF